MRGLNNKQCKVVMLATKNSHIILNNSGILVQYSKSLSSESDFTSQHLYFLSDEEIQEGDIILMPCAIGKVKEIRYEDGNKRRSLICEDLISLSLRYGQKENQLQTNSFLVTDCKKIIATTDESLFFKKEGKVYLGSYISAGLGENLPQPSQSFINKYIEEYNKGSVIEDVLVEYEEYDIPNKRDNDGYPIQDYGLKIDSDNTITIKKVKDSWSREELDNILNEVLNLGMTVRQNQLSGHEERSGNDILEMWKQGNL